MLNLKDKKEIFLLILAIFINLTLLLFSISNLSISYDEADIFFNKTGFLNLVVRNLGQNDYMLRLPFLIVHCINIVLLYKVSKQILKRRSDRLVCTILYMFLPGVLVSAILINEAGFVILITLLTIYFHQKEKLVMLAMIIILSFFISHSFIILYIAILIFGIYKKNNFFIIIGILSALVWFIINGVDTFGKPQGYFVDTIGVFAAVFSPFIFLYFIYATYRIWVKEEKNFLWVISTTAFCLCVILSFRQKLSLELFLPFCVIFTPLMVKIFFNSYRVRLPKFRIMHKIFTIFVLISLVVNSFITIFHNTLYLFLENPQKHFAYKYDIAKQLSLKLKGMGIHAVNTDKDMSLRLKFYGIKSSKIYFLDTHRKNNCKTIEIKKFNKIIDKYYLCLS